MKKASLFINSVMFILVDDIINIILDLNFVKLIILFKYLLTLVFKFMHEKIDFIFLKVVHLFN